MLFTILHLSDIHFKNDNNWIANKKDHISNILMREADEGSEFIFLLISGDLVFSGNSKEFSIAKLFINDLLELIEDFFQFSNIEVVIVPGNHDCCLDDTNNTLIRNILKNREYLIDENFYNISKKALVTQEGFWKFYREFNAVPENKIVYHNLFKVDDCKINFECINSSWLSSREEKQGDIYIPINLLRESSANDSNIINITVLHHPPDWLDTKTVENNKRAFLDYLRLNSSFTVFGHEHYNRASRTERLDKGGSLILLAGGSLDSVDKEYDTPSFNIYNIDTSKKSLRISTYSWGTDAFLKSYSGDMTIRTINRNIFKNKEVYLNLINNINLPIQQNNQDVLLSDLFVFPDLDQSVNNNEHINGTVNSKILMENTYGINIIEGDAQSGKSALLNMLYLEFLNQNKYPLLISANSKKINIERLLSDAYHDQYIKDVKSYDYFIQYDSSEKILLIDNFENFKFKENQELLDFMTIMKKSFKKIIITVGFYYDLITLIKSHFQEVHFFQIKQLGYKKRNDLIEKYYLHSHSRINKEDLFSLTNNAFEKITNIIGRNYLPSYPIYLLSILQTIDSSRPINTQLTTHAYCYQSLITIALINNASIKSDKIDTYIKFLSELSLFIYKKNKQSISEGELLSFYTSYSSSYIVPNYIEIIDNIMRSKLVVCYDGDYSFSYKYIYYYFVAQAISSIVNTDEGMNNIHALCQSLHEEESANILIFLTHHSRDERLIYEATVASMNSFPDTPPISLHLEDKIFSTISDISHKISDSVLRLSKEPQEVREELLEEMDKESKEDSDDKSSTTSIDEYVQRVNYAVRSIEILGQIIKNRHGSIEKPKLNSMIEELYLTGFRTINNLQSVLEKNKSVFVDSILKDLDGSETKQKIISTINKIHQYIVLNACLSIFTKIMFSVGHKDLKELYKNVSNKISTPAADLVSFAIITYYDGLTEGYLKDIVKKYKNNSVVLTLIKMRVKSHIYQNYMPYDKVQRISSILNLKITGKRFKSLKS